jgi:DNA-binding NtrC family response regulator
MAQARQNVLVVDDDAATCEGLTALLESWGYQASAVSNGQAALRHCNQDLPHAIVSDLLMPGMSGLEFIEALHERVHQVAIIMLTGQATIETAVQAMKLGAYDFLPKPLEPAKLRAVLEKGLNQVGFAREANVLRQKLESPLGSYGELIGKSATMRQIYKRLSQIALTDAAVLVSGESGTGKELVARTLHDLSRRREGIFLALNCAAVAPPMMESKLFGYEKGAFTNALERHLGCFEEADGGTLFVDEITELSAEVQAKFLRVLEEGQVRRIGASASIPVAVRVVVATNRLPVSAVKEGKLNQDLFYHLKSFHLALPPLRERGDDVPLLARYYLESFGEKYQRPTMPWASDFVEALFAHSWPGNVRELRNAMERLALRAPGQI